MSIFPTSKRPAGWRRFVFYRTESVRTTWAFRVGVSVAALAVIAGGRPWWERVIGSSLVCSEAVAPSDLLLVENFDPDYDVFERAATLHRDGIAPRVVVPVLAESEGAEKAVAIGTAELMARLARLPGAELLPLEVREPITLNAAKQLREFLTRGRVASMTVVAPDFRSRRSQLVYSAVLTPAGITVRCVPVIGHTTPDNWTETWHGIQDVALQFLKLQYYRFYIIPMKSER
jgi:hypothetical protein